MEAEEALRKAKEEAAIPTESVDQYINRMVKEKPKEKAVCGDYPAETKIPGFEEMTLLGAELYGATWEELVILADMKRKVASPFIVKSQVGIHVVRCIDRAEWEQLEVQLISATKDLMQAANKAGGIDEEVIKAKIRMKNEELIAVRGCVYPKYDGISIRSLPAGTVSFLADSVTFASGHSQQPLPPIALK